MLNPQCLLCLVMYTFTINLDYYYIMVQATVLKNNDNSEFNEVRVQFRQSHSKMAPIVSDFFPDLSTHTFFLKNPTRSDFLAKALINCKISPSREINCKALNEY